MILGIFGQQLLKRFQDPMYILPPIFQSKQGENKLRKFCKLNKQEVNRSQASDLPRSCIFLQIKKTSTPWCQLLLSHVHVAYMHTHMCIYIPTMPIVSRQRRRSRLRHVFRSKRLMRKRGRGRRSMRGCTYIYILENQE